MMRIAFLTVICQAVIAWKSSKPLLSNNRRFFQTVSSEIPVDKYSGAFVDFNIRPSITDKARTVSAVCTSGTFCTTCAGNEHADVKGSPFGSYVDYVLDERGWPVLLLGEQSLHTRNIKQNSAVSLFCQLPRSESSTSAASLSRVTISGDVQKVDLADQAELTACKLAFTIAHTYAEQIVESPIFSFYKIKPRKIYFSGGFGVQSTWVNVEDYELSKPDVLASEVSTVLSRVNIEKQGELLLMCKHFLGIDVNTIEFVSLQAVDRLGIDVRVKTLDFTDEYRIGYRYQVNSAEDAKSEMLKLFQEAWERENGYSFTDTLPPYTKYAEDLLRKK